jgi:hypothetical protein
MTDIAPRSPILGLLRLAALAWTLLSLLGVVIGVLIVVYAGAWGCVGNARGWFECTLPTVFIPFAAVASFASALVVLFFSHLFYVAGATARDVAPRPRPTVRGFVFDIIADILD